MKNIVLIIVALLAGIQSYAMDSQAESQPSKKRKTNTHSSVDIHQPDEDNESNGASIAQSSRLKILLETTLSAHDTASSTDALAGLASIASAQITGNNAGFPCNIPGCNKSFANKENKREHWRSTHKLEHFYKCPIDGCRETKQADTNYVRVFKAHMARHMANNDIVPEDYQPNNITGERPLIHIKRKPVDACAAQNVPAMLPVISISPNAAPQQVINGSGKMKKCPRLKQWIDTGLAQCSSNITIADTWNAQRQPHEPTIAASAIANYTKKIKMLQNNAIPAVDFTDAPTDNNAAIVPAASSSVALAHKPSMPSSIGADLAARRAKLIQRNQEKQKAKSRTIENNQELKEFVITHASNGMPASQIVKNWNAQSNIKIFETQISCFKKFNPGLFNSVQVGKIGQCPRLQQFIHAELVKGTQPSTIARTWNEQKTDIEPTITKQAISDYAKRNNITQNNAIPAAALANDGLLPALASPTLSAINDAHAPQITDLNLFGNEDKDVSMFDAQYGDDHEIPITPYQINQSSIIAAAAAASNYSETDMALLPKIAPQADYFGLDDDQPAQYNEASGDNDSSDDEASHQKSKKRKQPAAASSSAAAIAAQRAKNSEQDKKSRSGRIEKNPELQKFVIQQVNENKMSQSETAKKWNAQSNIKIDHTHIGAFKELHPQYFSAIYAHKNKIQNYEPLQTFIMEKHAEGLSNRQIAKAWNEQKESTEPSISYEAISIFIRLNLKPIPKKSRKTKDINPIDQSPILPYF